MAGPRNGRRNRRLKVWLYTGLILTTLLTTYLYFARAGIWGLPAEVVSVTDGDTIKVIFRGESNSVRLLGIECPETRHTKKQAEQAETWGIPVERVAEIGQKGTDRVEEMIQPGDEVRLVFPDAKVKQDYFRRWLAYVEISGEDIGEILLEEGLADLYETKHPRREMYQGFRDHAERSHAKLWLRVRRIP